MTHRPALFRHPLSLLGAFLTTGAGVLFITMFTAELLGWHTNPYMGMVFFLILPGVFVLGLLVMPIGMWLDRRRRRRGVVADPTWPVLDLREPRQRRWTFFVLAATLVNIVIVSLASYAGVRHMDTPEFCGQVCHTVMEPEFTAYQDGPHSRVACVECHIGEGASGFVEAKMSGARQVVGVMTGRYARPVPAPVHNLRPARETCEHCHWPEKFHGDTVRVVRAYAPDETSTEQQMTMVLRVGGGSERLGIATGIHWHMNLANEIEYIATDDTRQVIPWVRLKDAAGNIREYQVDGVAAGELARGERRRMDCIDCHNRPAHRFDPTVDRAVDRAMAIGAIPTSLPFIKREASDVLGAAYPSREVALQTIATRLADFYRGQYPDLYASRRPEVDRAILGTQQLYRRNIFPAMNVTWGTYPSHIGHTDSPGCFRCHDDSHKSQDGKVIRQDCELCHTFQ